MSSFDFTCRPFTKKNCWFRLPRQQAGRDTKPVTVTSSAPPCTGTKPRAMSRPKTA